jgi:hypothetical protein
MMMMMEAVVEVVVVLMVAMPKWQHAFQVFIESFEYNYTGTNFYNVTGVKNDQSLLRVLSIAKECKLNATQRLNISANHHSSNSNRMMWKYAERKNEQDKELKVWNCDTWSRSAASTSDKMRRGSVCCSTAAAAAAVVLRFGNSTHSVNFFCW